MDKVFGVEITDGNDYYCLLHLPATDYELLDALERLHMKPNDKPRWEIIEHTDFQYLHVHLINECDLYQLNALANRLGQLDFCQKAAFEGLFNVEIYKKYGPISISTMIDLAYSTECCHVVEGVTTDAQLGEFYANNGFIPEVDALPDHLFKLLDFEKLGKKMRSEEGGIFTRQAYVTQHSELVQAYDKLILEPQRPEYAVFLHIGRYPFETDGLPDKMIPLELPASEEQMMQALIECGAASWDEVIFQVEDSAIPGLLGDMDFNNCSASTTAMEQRFFMTQKKQSCGFAALLKLETTFLNTHWESSSSAKDGLLKQWTGCRKLQTMETNTLSIGLARCTSAEMSSMKTYRKELSI